MALPGLEPIVAGPVLTAPERQAMADFWVEYQAHSEQIRSDLFPVLAGIPTFAALLASRPPAELEATAQHADALMARALRDGEWGPYLDDLRAQAANYARMGVDFTVWFEVGAVWYRSLLPHLLEKFGGEPKHLADVVVAANRFAQFRLSVICVEYLRHCYELGSRQQQEILALSTPVLLLRERILLLPLIGTLDADRARQLTEQLLTAIRVRRAKVVVMDITGVPTVDTLVANHLLQAIEAARLMGAVVVVTGLSAEAAQAMATLGLDLSQLLTVADLQGGVDEAHRILAAPVAWAAQRGAV